MLRMTSDPTEEAWTEAMGEAIDRTTDQTEAPIERGTFHTTIMKMNASVTETGMVSMDFITRIAEEGFTLWDRTFNTLAPGNVSVPSGTTTSTTRTRTGRPPSSGLSNEDHDRNRHRIRQLPA